MRLALISGMFAIIIGAGSAFAQPLVPPVSTKLAVVLPDALSDVPRSPPGVQTPLHFYNYSWRSFIALNWPAKLGPASRGLPDRTRVLGDTAGPRVWMTWKSRYEIFTPSGELPKQWASYEGQNPCGEGFANDMMTLSSFSGFGDFNQALENPLVAQNHTYVRYEVRVNEPEFDSIVGNKWYIASNLPTAATAISFNTGSTAVKAAWRVLSKSENTPNTRKRYYVARAQIFDVAKQKCILTDVALIGLHIVTKTIDHPQWIWSTFEHIDNVPFGPVENDPEATCAPLTPASAPLSLNNRHQPQQLFPQMPPASISLGNKPVADPQPMQAVRKHKIQTMRANCWYWAQLGIKDEVWQNYMLVMTQWVAGNGHPTPGPGSDDVVNNTAMETYSPDTSCMECHSYSNQNGRDFVMFVSVDAFRPGVRFPGDPYSVFNSGSSLALDPMLRSLMQFYEGTAQKRMISPN
jgi:hypothetical protein